jgi:predicted ATPase
VYHGYGGKDTMETLVHQDLPRGTILASSRKKRGDEKGRIMIKTLEIKNFRCFKDLYIRELKRFNVVVGESGSGKTALLEAIFIASAASPEIWMRLRQWRGSAPQFRLSGTRSSYESLFRDIFYNFEKRKPARVDFSDYQGKTRALKVSYPSQEKYVKSISADRYDQADENSFSVEPIVFGWKSKGKEQRARVDVKDGKVEFRGFNNVYPVWFSSPLINEGQIIAQMFSELSLKKKTDPLIRAVRDLYPEVVDITVESIAGDLALCFSIASLSERIPVGSMSSGITRFVALLVAVASQPGGVLLIDEFEVGFYYKTLPRVLRAIMSLCQEMNVQIVATTHSYEFMQILVSLIKEMEIEQEFCFFRSERNGPMCNVKLLEGFGAAIESAFEVR